MLHQSANQTLPDHPLGKARLGKGGHPRKFPDAYSCRGGGVRFYPHSQHIMEFSPDHPNATAARYMAQHRLVMECALGRLLRKDEVVHHLNGIQWDNRIENLELLDVSSHHRIHAAEQSLAAKNRFSEQTVREALEGRSTDQAADHLGVGRMTLYRHYDHLLAKRKSPTKKAVNANPTE